MRGRRHGRDRARHPGETILPAGTGWRFTKPPDETKWEPRRPAGAEAENSFNL